MNFTSPRLCLLLWPLSVAPAYSAAIQNLTFTDVVKDVIVIDVATKKESPAKAGDILVPPNVLKTGPDSRAELVAEDKTVTRVGANTIFSVEADSRDVNIAQGSVLFNSPKGKGGGRIKSAGATASVLGTTLIVGANPSGGFKVMLLEGKGQVDGAKGGSSKLSPGQMSFALPGKPPTAPLNFELKGSVGGSKLVGGFSKPLASIAKIEAAVNVQQSKIASGELQTTGLAIGDQPGVAVKVDTAVVRAAAEIKVKELKTAIAEAVRKAAIKVIDQVTPTPEVPTNSSKIPSADLLYALTHSLSISPDTSTDPLIAPEKFIFGIDGSAVEVAGKNAGSKMFIQVPHGVDTAGNPLSGDISNPRIETLFAQNITLTLPAPTEGSSTSSDIFLHSPVETKDASAILALKDININGNIAFTGFETVRTYPNLSGASTTQGSNVIQLTDIGGLEIGMTISGGDIPDGAKITEINTKNNTIKLDLGVPAPADGTGPTTSTNVRLSLSIKGTWTEGSSEVTVSNVNGMKEGMTIDSSSFPYGTTILAISQDGKLTLSQPALDTRADESLQLGGVQSGTPLILSAGNTIKISPGSSLNIATSLLDIYAAGSEFSAAETLTLATKPQTVKTALQLDSVAIVNEWPLESNGPATGVIRMIAPSIEIIDSKITAGNVRIESFEGDINISRRTATTLSTPDIFALGITNIDDLAISSEVLSVKSARHLSIDNIPLYTINSTFESGGNLSLSGVTFINREPLSAEQTITATSNTGDLEARDVTATFAMHTTLTAKAGDITLTDSTFGAVVTPSPSDTAQERTRFTAVAEKALVLQSLTNGDTGIFADTINLTSKDDLTIRGAKTSGTSETRLDASGNSLPSVDPLVDTSTVAIADAKDATITLSPTDSILGALNLTSKTGAVSVRNALITHNEVNITAGGDLIGPAPGTEGRTPSAAQLKNIIDLNYVNFTNAQRVALDATTIVLKDVTFNGTSNVYLNSFHGKVAAYPGMANKPTLPGYVNFKTGVTYGTTPIVMPDATTNMNNAQFQSKADAAFGVGKLSKITIGYQTGNAKTVGQ